MSEEETQKVQVQKRKVAAKMVGNMVAIDADFACRYPMNPSFSYRTGILRSSRATDVHALFVKGADPETGTPFEDEIEFGRLSDLDTVISDLDSIMIKYANDQDNGGRF